MSDNKNNEPNGEQPTKRKQRTQYRISKTGKKLKRIDGQYIFREITDVFLAKSGLFYTIKKMLLSPGKSTRHYLEKDRKPYVRPIVFVIVTSLFYALVEFFFPLQQFVEIRTYEPHLVIFVNPFFYSTFPDGGFAFLRWLGEMSAYTTLLLGLSVTAVARLLFKKSRYNFFEIFTLLCYLCGMVMLHSAVMTLLSHLPEFNFGIIGNVLKWIIRNLAWIYFVWAIGQFFDREQSWTKRNIGKKSWTYIRAYLSYIIGTLFYVSLLMLVAVVAGVMTFSDVVRYIIVFE